MCRGIFKAVRRYRVDLTLVILDYITLFYKILIWK